jgi:hypothetical protein
MTAVHVLGNAAPDGIVPPVCGRRARHPWARHMTVSNFILGNPEHGLQRAEEARCIAEELSDPESRRMILRIAEDYERFATHASRRRRAGWRKAETHCSFSNALAGFEGGGALALR